jgi:Flp pilus assembly pilin Flp
MFKEKITLFIKSSKAVMAIEYGLGLAFIGTTFIIGMTDAGTAIKDYMICISNNTRASTSCFQ